MKIIIHSLQELLELTALVRGGSSTTKVGEIEHTVKVDASDFDPVKLAQAITDHCETLQGQCEFEAACNRGQNELPHTPNAETLSAGVATLHLDGSVTTEAGLPTHIDNDGAPYNADWHSDPAKLNADGTWRARRKRDETTYKDWLLSLAVGVAEAAIAADDAEPVATETHALPQDHSDAPELNAALAKDATKLEAMGADPGVTLQELDHTALIEASQEAAKDAPDGTIDLLNAGKEFIKEYGTVKFEALKAAVSPLEDGKGKPIPSLTPGERRLLRACMDNYALYL